MRIGLFSDSYPPYINGVSTVVETTKRALEQAGHEVFVVTVNPETMSYKFEENGHIVRIPGLPTGIYDYRLTGIYPLKALKMIKNWNLDVIHSHTEFGVGTFARIIAKQYNIPLVHTYHTMYEDYVHYITKGYFDNVGKKIVEYLTKFYCDKTATELIVLSKKSFDLFRKKYCFDRDLHVIPTGIEVEKFYKENFTTKQIEETKTKLGIKKDDFVILFVGRLAKEKDVDLLIEIQASLVKKHSNCKLLIIGDGPDMDKFKNMVNKHKLNNHVIFTGKVPWVEITLYYQTCDIFVTASRTETQGLTVIEAMAASKPVVCADDDSFKEAVINDLNGFLFKNKKEYRSRVLSLIEKKEKKELFSNQARITADNHSTKFYSERLLYVYKRAIEKNGGSYVQKGYFERLKRNIKNVFKK